MNDRTPDRACEELTDSHERLLDELQGLLDRQIEQARQGNFGAVNALARQSGPLVERLTSAGIAETTEFKAGKQAVQDSYRKLLLMLDTADRDIADQLHSVRQGTKLVRAYRRTVP